MSSLALIPENPQHCYHYLMAHRRGLPLEDNLATMLASWIFGMGALPNWLGLDKPRFQWLFNYHFPTSGLLQVPTNRPVDPDRFAEMADLRELLLNHRNLRSDSEILVADIIVAGCMGQNHLWQDLGLRNRQDLSELMQQNFRPLVEKNNKDMKWKKFLYKQLCEAEGIYTCRVPSCDVCKDYANCYGTET